MGDGRHGDNGKESEGDAGDGKRGSNKLKEGMRWGVQEEGRGVSWEGGACGGAPG